MALVYEDLNDHQIFRENPLFQIISDRFIKDALPLTRPSDHTPIIAEFGL
jgi:hypothetical protein